ncbi:uncharacterized protein Fot_20976 [Forsythia ovata]|uniref:Uncharacterized protein n=1 Tax=Forsythia ovata TaxID=205694 RepID=A0ABD1UTH9_9LAMI
MRSTRISGWPWLNRTIGTSNLMLGHWVQRTWIPLDYLCSDEEVTGVAEVNSETHPQSQLPAFSGAFTSVQVRDVFETDIEHDNSSDRDGVSTIFEETESISIGEVMKSPVFNEDESSDNSL